MLRKSDAVDKHVGKRIRMRRFMLSLSQTALANELGLTFQQIQKYEKGVNRISSSRLQQISGVLQVPIAFFFEDQPRSAGDRSLADISGVLATPDGLSLASAFVDITDRKRRRAIVQLVEQIAAKFD